MSEFADDAGRFRLDSRIATGGMGEVWRATDTVLGRQVAVKLLKAEFADDPTFRARFETEAQHAASLHHPGIASVFDVGEKLATDGSGNPRPFLVMELVEGQPLSALLAGPEAAGGLDPQAVRDLLAQVGDALGAAHRGGIIHRDVKPANLIVTPQGKVKVTDFGIARAADGVGITRTGAVMGTPQYLSPEQAEGRTATAASDVYALGVVAFECLAGRRPFEADSPVATALAHLRQPVPDLPASVPADLASVVHQALSKKPEERFPDGAAFAAALRDPATAVVPRAPVAPVGPVPVPDTTRTQVLGAVPAAAVVPLVEPMSTQTTSTPAQTPRNPWPIVALVLLLVALAVVLVVLLTGNDDTEPSSGATTSTPSRTRSTQPSREPSSSATEAETVFVNEGDFIGEPIEAAEADLRGLGLEVERNAQPNDNPDLDGLVTGVNPSGDVALGDVVTVTYYDEAPEVTEEPTTEPEPEPEPEPTTEPLPSETIAPEPTEPLPSETLPAEGVTTP